MVSDKKKIIIEDNKENSEGNVEVSQQSLDVGTDEERPGVGYEIFNVTGNG